MSVRASAMILVAAAVAGAAVAVWSPALVDRCVPGVGARALALREVLPAFVRDRLPPADAIPALAATGTPPAPPSPGAGAGQKPDAAPTPRPATSVLVASVERRAVPVRLDAIGSVTPVASVAVRTRIDGTIDQILAPDGALVKAGDVLIKLSSRQIEAQIKQAQAVLAKDRAALEQAQRDVARFTELVAHQATAQVNLDNAKTAVTSAQAQIQADQAMLENLQVSLSWHTLSAPISGRIGTITQKVGNVVRSGDNSSAGTLTTINQISPIYVAFSLPQRSLPALRAAMAGAGAQASATPQGAKDAVSGKVTVLDNAIDPGTGTITARALFDNADEKLWPGELCDVRITLSTENDAIVVPREAVQASQSGTFVYLIENNVAHVRPVTVERTQDTFSVIAKGLSGGESVVIDGALLLVDGAPVEVRQAKKEAS